MYWGLSLLLCCSPALRHTTTPAGSIASSFIVCRLHRVSVVTLALYAPRSVYFSFALYTPRSVC